jgi:hypothetical protein
MNCAFSLLLAAVLAPPALPPAAPATFGDDVAFLKQHVSVVVLQRGDAQVAVVPGYQCRVMTSTGAGDGGASYGWVNRELIESGKVEPHINVYGGEDRIWLGPEGGQFGLFFKKGDAFDLAHWQVPAPIDTQPFDVVSTTADTILCRKNIRLTNASSTVFSLDVAREVILRDPAVVVKSLGIDLPANVKAVAFSTTNTIRNTGKTRWTERGGLLSIWILGMFNASPMTTVVIPYRTAAEGGRGQVVHDTYFGKVPADRLADDDGVLYFKADANYRSKIGIPPKRAKSVMGSYDRTSQTLTLVTYTLPSNPTRYVNSMWEVQSAPFGGDAANAYNDGPPQPGTKQLGAFYELESSSPALALAPGQTATHVQTTIHLQGSPEDLDGVAVAVLGRGLEKINNALGQ